MSAPVAPAWKQESTPEGGADTPENGKSENKKSE
jgi:hypothetical protein